MKPIFKITLTKIYIGTALALLLLFGMMTLGFLTIRERQGSFESVKHTFEVIAQLQKMETEINEAGRLQRSYILTEREEYIEQFKHSYNQLYAAHKQTARLISDNQVQNNTLQAVKRDLDRLSKTYSKNIRLAAGGRLSQALLSIKSGESDEIASKLLIDLTRMIDHEKSLLEDRLEKHNQFHDRTNFIMSFAAAVAFFMVLFAAIMIMIEFRQRSHIQRSLNHSLELQKAIFDSAAFAIIATDKDGKITLFNPAAEKLLGYTTEEVQGKNPEFFHLQEEIEIKSKELSEKYQEHIPAGFETLTFNARTGRGRSEEWTYVRKDGKHIPVSLSVTSQKNADGLITGWVGLAYDISSELEYKKQILHAKDLAEAGTNAKSEFLANMSHEIRTPMNAILGMAELLKETKLDDEQEKYVDIFYRAGEGLLTLINDILDLSKIEAGHFELDIQSFNLSEVVEKSVEIMSVKAHQKNLELLVDIDEDMKDRFIGDGNRISQILLNLLGNAIKFTRKGEILLKVTTGEKKGKTREIILRVHDTGIGMSDDQQKFLFQRFTQADSSITKEFGGTGLGLNITRKLVDLMGGKIEVKSSYGVGSVFTVTIRLEEDESLLSEKTSINFTGKNFLIIDDNKTNRYIFKKILEGQGGSTDEAENGKIGIELLEKMSEKNEFYDLILLDSRMPEMNGFEFAKKLKSLNKYQNQLVMMITSDNRPGDLAKVKDLGLRSYLVKPVLKTSLLREIEKVLFTRFEVKRTTSDEKVLIEKHLRILLVDDNDENRIVIKAFLKPYQWEISEAKNGFEALKMYEENNFDLILMDMQMPVMDGYSATVELRQREKHNGRRLTPIIALTAYALEEEVQKSFSAGCNDHLSKPVSKKTLMKSIQEYTGHIFVTVDEDLADIVPDFLERRKLELSELKQLLDKKEFESIAATGHKLKGSAGSFGFAGLSNIGKQIEDKARNQDKDGVNHALIQYDLYLQKLKLN